MGRREEEEVVLRSKRGGRAKKQPFITFIKLAAGTQIIGQLRDLPLVSIYQLACPASINLILVKDRVRCGHKSEEEILRRWPGK